MDGLSTLLLGLHNSKDEEFRIGATYTLCMPVSLSGKEENNMLIVSMSGFSFSLYCEYIQLIGRYMFPHFLLCNIHYIDHIITLSLVICTWGIDIYERDKNRVESALPVQYFKAIQSYCSCLSVVLLSYDSRSTLV